MNLPVQQIEKVTLSCKIKRTVWNIVCFFLFRPFGTKLFRPWRIALLNLFGGELQKDSEVYASVKIWAPWNLRMGHRACLGPDVICYNQDMVELEDDAIVSQYSYLCTAGHETTEENSADSGLITAPIVLEKKAWVGTRSFIGMGVRVGASAIVGATASVFKSVEANTIVGGNPAKFIKKRELTHE